MNITHNFRSILTSEKEQLTLLQFPPLDGVPSPVTVIELGPATNACPSGLCKYSRKIFIQ